MDGSRQPLSGEQTVCTFAWADLVGEIVEPFVSRDLEASVRHVLDPASAVRTVHWGRNYLYESVMGTDDGPRRVVVKQFRNQGWRRRLDRRLRGSKAERAWRAARALIAAGFCTPSPVLLAESTDAEGASYLVTAVLEPAHEVRQFFRRLNEGDREVSFPDVEPAAFLKRLGRFARAIHDAGFWYRDLSLGNILAHPSDEGRLDLCLVDCNRVRTGVRLGPWRRTRDICRLPVLDTAHRSAFLAGYWGGSPRRSDPRWWLYAASVRGYILKHQLKAMLRGGRGRHSPAPGGTHHAHIPPPSREAGFRDRSVWDPLSDQPHQHASRWQKAAIRSADAPSHLRDLALVAASLPALWRQYRRLVDARNAAPVRFTGVGLAVRPLSESPDAHLRALLETGVRRVLLRVHPWEVDHDAEEELARALRDHGVEVAISLPQNRELVRDPQRWRASVGEIGERFAPLASDFVVGHAVNRSKWGVWITSEYLTLFREAEAVLRPLPGVRLFGPAVIDFEFQLTLAYLRRRSLHLDGVASLLYVDRRGAPENRQLGLDTVGKVTLLRALCDVTGRPRIPSWVTEVNWPLWEGPHSPAGRAVSVDEETQADYLVRYYILALGTGLVDRVYWWRLTARGYGLTVLEPDGSLRRRPSHLALATLVRQLDGTTCLGPAPSPPGTFVYRFDSSEGPLEVAWSVASGARAELGFVPRRAIDRDGSGLRVEPRREVEVGPSPVYYWPE
jgi:tRNA A-37 threonylcarbamoyl transferase component Bud32